MTRKSAPAASSGRLASSEQVAEQRGFLRELGEQIGRKADQAAPDHPADALIVAGREIPPAPDQDRERGDADGEADEQHGRAPRFRRDSRRRSPCWRAPRARNTIARAGRARSIVRHRPSVRSTGALSANSEKPGIGGGLHHEENDVLRQKRAGPKLEPGPELKRLAGIELDHIDEETPGHEAWARPHQPGRAEHDQDSGDRVEHNDEVEQAIGGPRLGDELDFACQRVFWRRGEDKRRLASRRDVGDAAPLRQQARADDGVDGRAAHRGKIEPIAGAQARSPSRRIVLAFERTLDVVNPSVAVHRETERAQRANDPKQVRGDHRQRIDGQKQEGDAAEKARALPVTHQPMLRGARRGTSFSSAEEGKLSAAQVFVHKPRRVVAVLEGVARVIWNRAGEPITERAIERFGRVARSVEREQPSALFGRASFDLLHQRPADAGAAKGRIDQDLGNLGVMALARHRIEIELRRSGDIAAKRRDEDELAAGRVRRGDPVQPVGARFAPLERHDEADARALVHAGLQDLGEPFDGFGERGGVERGDIYGLGCSRISPENENVARRARPSRNETARAHQLVAKAVAGAQAMDRPLDGQLQSAVHEIEMMFETRTRRKRIVDARPGRQFARQKLAVEPERRAARPSGGGSRSPDRPIPAGRPA